MKIAKIENFGRLFIESDWEMARAQTIWTKEPETIAWIDSFNGEGLFWDIGANIGLYSLYCAKKHENMIIRAFEPMKNNFIRLWQNILLNDFINVTAYFTAFGFAVGTKNFSANDVVGSSGGIIGDGGYPIKVISGDYLSAITLRVPNYIKIDTDNNEYDILCGMTGILKDDRLKSVLVEVNKEDRHIKEMMEYAGLYVDEKAMAKKDRGSDHNVIFTRRDYAAIQ